MEFVLKNFEHVQHFENCIECRSLVYAVIDGLSVHFVLPKKKEEEEEEEKKKRASK